MSHHYGFIDQGDAFFNKQLAQISYPFGTLTQDSWAVKRDPSYQDYVKNREAYRAIDNPTREQDLRMNNAFNFGMSQNPSFNAGEVAAFGKTSKQGLLDFYAGVDEAKATKDVADAKAISDWKDTAISDSDAIGWEDPNKVYSSIATPQPEPSFKANNYNAPSLLGNVQAASSGMSAGNPPGSMLDNVVDFAKENAGSLTAGAIAAKALSNVRGWAEHGATQKTLDEIGKQSLGKTWGQEKASGYDKNFKAQPGAAKVSHSSYNRQGVKSLFGVYDKGSNVGGGTPMSQKPFQNAAVKAVLNSPVARGLANVANKLGTAGLAWGVGNLAYGTTNTIMDTKFADKYGFGRQDLRGYGAGISSLMSKDRGLKEAVDKDKRDYRRDKREERAEEVRAKAQAVADAKAKVEAEAKAAEEARAEEARQTEREKQRMVESNSFSDTDSGSFDEGGNYSDWGSQEEYDDDFGEDSHW
jgi:hypothetical protein